MIHDFSPLMRGLCGKGPARGHQDQLDKEAIVSLPAAGLDPECAQCPRTDDQKQTRSLRAAGSIHSAYDSPFPYPVCRWARKQELDTLVSFSLSFSLCMHTCMVIFILLRFLSALHICVYFRQLPGNTAQIFSTINF